MTSSLLPEASDSPVHSSGFAPWRLRRAFWAAFTSLTVQGRAKSGPLRWEIRADSLLNWSFVSSGRRGGFSLSFAGAVGGVCTIVGEDLESLTMVSSFAEKSVLVGAAKSCQSGIIQLEQEKVLSRISSHSAEHRQRADMRD